MDESGEAKFERDLRQLEEKRRTQEEAAEKGLIEGSGDEQEGQEETAEEREVKKSVRRREAQKRERGESKERASGE